MTKAQLDLRDQMDLKGLRENKDHKVLKVIQAALDLKGFKE